MSKLGKIIEKVKEFFFYMPIRDEIKCVSRHLKKIGKEIEYIEKEKKEIEVHLSFLNGKLEQLKKGNKQLEDWNTVLINI
ncbi:unnamed protein product [marine sediment metagenome]|uniref:Uncharacterized protein n=1 Tax=marine sediment metagenome TaxID=412755 RepID=X1K4Q7_9ZZZZ